MNDEVKTEPVIDTLITEKKDTPIDFTTKPEGFPDDFWDTEKKAPNVDRLYKEFQNRDKIAKDLRVKLGKGEFEGKPPEDIKEYTLELDEKLKPLVPDDDPILQSARESAKAAGLPKEAFNKFITPIVAKLAELKAQSEALLTPEEIEAVRVEKVNQLGPTGQKIVEACASFIDQLKAGGTLNEEEAKAARAMVFDANSAKVMNKLRMMAGGSDQVPVEVPVDPGASRKDIEAKMAKAFLENKGDEYEKYSRMLASVNN